MCSTILLIWLCQERNKTYRKVSFSFEKLRTEQTVDSICHPQRLETNKTLCFVRTSFWRKLHRSRWNAKSKMVDERHTYKTFQGAAKNPIIVITNQPVKLHENLSEEDWFVMIRWTLLAKEMLLRVLPIWTKQLLLMVFNSKNQLVMHCFVTSVYQICISNTYLMKKQNSPKF